MTKNGRSFDLPILQLHHEILASLRPLSKIWIFPSSKVDKPIGTSLAEFIKASGTPRHKQARQTTVLTKPTAKNRKKTLAMQEPPTDDIRFLNDAARSSLEADIQC